MQQRASSLSGLVNGHQEVEKHGLGCLLKQLKEPKWRQLSQSVCRFGTNADLESHGWIRQREAAFK